jgi:hypothetical protein
VKKITILLLLLFSFLSPFSCRKNIKEQKHYQVRTDVRLGSKFYCIYVNEAGKTYVVKGTGSNYTEQFKKIITSDTSKIFRSDDMKVFFYKVKNMQSNPVIIPSNITDAARIEIYFKSKKVYDSYGFDKGFMDLFRPIMGQLPNGFNPFLANDHPFD